MTANVSVGLYISGFAASPLAAHAHEPAWQLTSRSRRIVGELIASLGADYRISGDVAVHETATVEPGAVLKGPAVVGPDCFVADGAYLRDGCWLDERCILGPGAELKSSFLFAGTKLAHFNFVGDSVLGAGCNLEAGSIIANYRNERDGDAIVICLDGERIATGVSKFGALLGDRVRLGANAVIAPGAVLPAGTIIPRLGLVDQS